MDTSTWHFLARSIEWWHPTDGNALCILVKTSVAIPPRAGTGIITYLQTGKKITQDYIHMRYADTSIVHNKHCTQQTLCTTCGATYFPISISTSARTPTGNMYIY